MRRTCFGFNFKRFLSVGQSCHGFVLKEVGKVEEKNLDCFLFQHERTGARHFHVKCDDSNNTFLVGFLTIPQDDTGVAHVLEHTALCGSQKYPVRDPFFNMIKRSLNTFMNAFTGADFTMYPFSTQNQKDFSNLMSVYLDATLNPKLDRMDFLQEGHRLEWDGKQLTRTGIVFNEMHGALADSSSLFREQIGAALYPTTTYGKNSGGDPKAIPDLTWEGLKAFHSKHYHPSNAWFYTYGDFPMEGHLKQIDEALTKFDLLPEAANFFVPMETPFQEPKRLSCSGPPAAGQEPLDQQYKSAVVWLMPFAKTDMLESLSMYVVSELLLEGPSAPMYRVFLETRMGNGYATMTGYEPYNKQPSFGVGINGATKEDAEKVFDLVFDTLRQCVKEGFPKQRIDSVLHQLELSNKHVTAGFGLNAGMGCILPAMHHGNPIDALQFDKWMNVLRERMSNGRYLEELVEKMLLENKHYVLAFQSPDEVYSQNLKDEERRTLDHIQSTLTDADKGTIVADSEALKQRQNAPPNVECLPTLSEDDIPRSKPKVDVVLENGVRFCKQPTNGITYLNMVLDVSKLPAHLVPVLPLWCSLVTNVGAGGHNYRDFAQLIDECTGGISVSPSLSSGCTEYDKYQMSVTLHSHCLEANEDKMMKLITQLLVQPDWSDRENIAALIEQNTSDLLDSLARSGHSYAVKAANAVFGTQHALAETWSGMNYVSFLSDLSQKLEKGTDVLEELVKSFNEIESHLRNPFTMRVQVNAERLSASMLSNLKFVQNLDSQKYFFNDDTTDNLQSSMNQKIFFPIPSQVNFVAQTFETGLAYTSDDYASLVVGAKVLSSCFLHREIREKGGAYGSFCNASSDGVLFNGFVS